MNIDSSTQIRSGFIYKLLFIFLTSISALMVIKILPAEQLGIWYIFMAVQSFILILNNSLTPNITRQFSIGISQSIIDVKTYCKLMREIYIVVVLLILAISLIITFSYLNSVLDIFSYHLILFSWILLLISILFEVYYSLYECALNGAGFFKETNKINFISRVILTILTIFLIITSHEKPENLIFFCSFYLLSNIYKRIKIKKLYFSTFKNCNDNHLIKNTITNYLSNKKTIYYLVYLSLISSIGGILITRSAFYILPYYSNLNDIASYGLTYQLFEMGFNIIFMLTTMLTPLLIDLYYNNPRKIKNIYFKLKYISLFFYMLVCIFIVYMIPYLLELFNIKTHLLERYQLLFISVLFILQLNHSISGHILTVENKIPFAYPSLITGIFTLILSLILIQAYNIYGAIFSLLISQLLFNNWFWPIKAYFFVRRKYEN